MPGKRYLVTLTPEERDRLTGLMHSGKGAARTLTRARILLKADQADGGPAWEDARIAEALDVGHRTVERATGSARPRPSPAATRRRGASSSKPRRSACSSRWTTN